MDDLGRTWGSSCTRVQLRSCWLIDTHKTRAQSRAGAAPAFLRLLSLSDEERPSSERRERKMLSQGPGEVAGGACPEVSLVRHSQLCFVHTHTHTHIHTHRTWNCASRDVLPTGPRTEYGVSEPADSFGKTH